MENQIETTFQIRVTAKNFAKILVALCNLNESGRELANELSLNHEIVVPQFQTELNTIMEGK